MSLFLEGAQVRNRHAIRMSPFSHARQTPQWSSMTECRDSSPFTDAFAPRMRHSCQWTVCAQSHLTVQGPREVSSGPRVPSGSLEGLLRDSRLPQPGRQGEPPRPHGGLLRLAWRVGGGGGPRWAGSGSCRSGCGCPARTLLCWGVWAKFDK